MDNVTVIEINGVEYYCPNDYLQYLVVVNNRLVNVGTSTITLYHEFRESGISGSGYPRISIGSMQYATYQQTQSYTGTTLNVSSYEIQHRVTPTNTFLLIAIVLVLILHWFKGR